MFRAAAEIAGTHSRCIGQPVQLTEALRLKGADEGHQNIGNKVVFSAKRQERHYEQQEHFGKNDNLPPVYHRLRQEKPAYPFIYKYAAGKSENRDKARKGIQPPPFCQIHAHQHDIACLGVGKYAAPCDVCISVQKAADNCQQRANQKGF